MKIHKIDTSLQSDVKKFKEFPFELYKGCDYWVPTMDSEITLALDRNKHPFYKHSEADFFIVETERQVIGRIGAIYNQNYNHFTKSSIGFFYYFDTVDDLEVSTPCLTQLLIGPSSTERNTFSAQKECFVRTA
jgi:hypothetical protein